MTLPQNGKKLSKIEEESMEIALKESGIGAIHPERMEALADSMVEKVKEYARKTTSLASWRCFRRINSNIALQKMLMDSIEQHIEKDKEILQDPTVILKCAAILKVNCMI